MTMCLRKVAFSGQRAASARHAAGSIRPLATAKPRWPSRSVSREMVMRTSCRARTTSSIRAPPDIYCRLRPSPSPGTCFGRRRPKARWAFAKLKGVRDMAEPVQTDKEQRRLIRMAETISKALPYMRRHNDATFVVKYGGHAMTDPKLGDLVARDIVLMKQVGMNPIVVHGGGPQINKMLDRVGLKSSFVNGLRVTDAATMEIVEMVLAGSINKAIVADINECGGIAVGICGKDGNLILANKVTEMRDPKTGELLKVDLKQVGEPAKINVMVLEQLRRADVIPVVAPIGFGVDDELTYNINADTSAGAIAGAMKAKRLLFLTDVPGVLDKDGKLISEMNIEQARGLIADGTISGGMIPKVENCIDAINRGVEAATILDGRVPHALLLEIFTEAGIGTMVKRS